VAYIIKLLKAKKLYSPYVTKD